MVAAQGQHVALNGLWLHHYYLAIAQTPASGVAAGLLSPDVCETLTDIEFGRYETIARPLLSGRERYMQDSFCGLDEKDKGPLRRAFADTIRQVGGVAVIGGTEQAVNMAAGIYEGLRYIGSGRPV